MTTQHPATILEAFIPVEQPLRQVFKLYENTFEKYCFVGVLLSIIVMCFSGLVYFFTKQEFFGFAMIVGLLGQYLSIFMYHVSLVFPMLKHMAQPKRTLLIPTVEEFKGDLQQARYLAKNFDAKYLRFAQERLALKRAQLLERIKWLVGSIETVGIFPLAIAAYFAVKKFEAEKLPVDFASVMGGGIGVATIYIAALILCRVSQDFERDQHTLSMALELKTK